MQDDILNKILKIARLTHEVFALYDKVDFEVIHQPKGNHNRSLKKGEMAVYTFFYGDQCLKVGQVGPNSNARYRYQHYGFNAKSTLAKSLVNDKTLNLGLNETNVGEWIKNNCDRYDVIIKVPEKKSKLLLNLYEGALQYCLGPKYEG